MLKELAGVVAGRLGLGESGGQCRPGGVAEDLLGVVGQDGSYVPGMAFHGVGGWLALRQGSQWLSCGVLVGHPEVGQSLLGGDDLLVVPPGPVPAGCGDDDQDSDVEEHRQPARVAGDRCGAQRAYRAAQGARLILFGLDAGAGGAFEGGGGLQKLCSQVAGGEQWQAHW